MKSYATSLGLRFPLGSPIDLDQEFDPFLSSRYRDTEDDGRWYVAGWRGKDGLNLHRDRGEALCGEWVLCAPLQRVLGTPEWERTQEMDARRGLRRERGGAGVVLEGYVRPEGEEIPTPGEIVAYLERESWGSGEYEDYGSRPLSYEELLKENPHAATLRREWAVSPYTLPSSSPYRRLVEVWSARRRGDWGQRDAALWVRYIRRGVAEPWELFDIVRDEDQALKQIDHAATPLSPRLELLRQVEREEWDQIQIKKEQEEREKREQREKWEKHERSEACYWRMYEGKDEKGRTLARKWSATMNHLNAERRDVVERLREDQEFRSLYDAVLDAEKVQGKKRAVREVLRWLRVKERVNVRTGTGNGNGGDRVKKQDFQDPDIYAPILRLAVLLANPKPELAYWYSACERLYGMIVRQERARILAAIDIESRYYDGYHRQWACSMDDIRSIVNGSEPEPEQET